MQDSATSSFTIHTLPAGLLLRSSGEVPGSPVRSCKQGAALYPQADGCGRQGFSRLRHTRDAVVITERSGNQDVVDASQGVRDSSSQLSSSSDLHIIIKITKIINRGKLVCAPWHVAKDLIIHIATLGLCLC